MRRTHCPELTLVGTQRRGEQIRKKSQCRHPSRPPHWQECRLRTSHVLNKSVRHSCCFSIYWAGRVACNVGAGRHIAVDQSTWCDRGTSSHSYPFENGCIVADPHIVLDNYGKNFNRR